MLFCFNLKLSPSCQFLSKPLDMSKKKLLRFNPILNDVNISWVTDNICLMQEWKLEWLLEMSLLAEKKTKILLKISLSKILPQIESEETGS